ncbi:MAG: L,D-transpeptidase [Actinomycetota bacterium]|nr:L,D-transpeptidase [Actinomycetota bacterium]
MQPTISLKKGSDPEILDRVIVTGRVPFPRPGHKVHVRVTRDGRKAFAYRLRTDRFTGRYRMRLKLRGCCEYMVQAADSSGRSAAVRFEVGVPSELEAGRQAALFNQLLRASGFHMDRVTDEPDEATGLAIMALRKTHELPLSEDYSPELFNLLLSGDAAFEPVQTADGRHVEVDVSRQVMALVEDGKATDVFHVSTGAGGTPRGQWSFYSKAPGYNAKGMYYSIFYDGEYATHGYSSVPTYPASHGCTRNPIPYSVFIYDWISLGDEIYVYD